MRRLGADQWPRWIELIPASGKDPAVECRFAKITRRMKRVAQAEAAALLPALEEGQERAFLDQAEAGEAYTRSIIRQGLLDWRGIGDAAGKPLAVTPESLDLFLADDDLFERADQIYVTPEVLRDAEKNGLSALPSGTGGAVTPGNGTASSRARGRKAPASGVKTAPTPSTRRAARKGKKSGT